MKKPYSPWAYLYYLYPLVFVGLTVLFVSQGKWINAVLEVIVVAVTGYMAYNWSQNKSLEFVPNDVTATSEYDEETDLLTIKVNRAAELELKMVERPIEKKEAN